MQKQKDAEAAAAAAAAEAERKAKEDFGEQKRREEAEKAAAEEKKAAERKMPEEEEKVPHVETPARAAKADNYEEWPRNKCLEVLGEDPTSVKALYRLAVI